MRGGLPLAAAGIRLRSAEPSAAPIVDVARFDLAAGARIALTGPSGCGKTSLLHCLAGITRPGAGSIAWGDTDIAALSGAAGDAWRRRVLGIVFQDFHLVPELDVEANILLPAQFASARLSPDTRARARDLAAGLGLHEPRRRAGLLSRGEQQRTAIARALLGQPAVILADEPTASLDRANADALGGILIEAASRSGATLIVATHDPGLIRRLDRTWDMRDGRLVGERPAS